MKKFTLIFAMLAIVFGLSAQTSPIFSVAWGNAPADADWDATPFDKETVVIPMANVALNGAVDIEMSAAEIEAIWGALGDPNLVANPAGGDMETITDPFDLTVVDGALDGTFGPAWKAFYDDNGFYIILKYIDAGELATARWFEIAIQSYDWFRWETGWQAATDGSETQDVINNQYGRFTELGGGKTELLDDGGIKETVTQTGTTGAWGPALLTPTESAMTTNADNSQWWVVSYEWPDVQFYTDPLAAAGAGNQTAMDPTVQTKISFEVSARATLADGTYASWWNSTENDGYKFVYYAGNIEFGTDVFDRVGVTPNSVSDKVAYIYNDMLRLKGFDTAVDLDIYSIIGQKVLSAQSVDGELNVSELNEGVYIVKVRGERTAFKVLK